MPTDESKVLDALHQLIDGEGAFDTFETTIAGKLGEDAAHIDVYLTMNRLNQQGAFSDYHVESGPGGIGRFAGRLNMI